MFIAIISSLSADDSELVIELIRKNQEIPEYLKTKVKHLDMTRDTALLGSHGFLVASDRKALEFIFNQIAQTFTNLESLVLSEKANDEWLFIVAEKFPQLKCLYITGLHYVNEIGLGYIANNLKSIKKLGLAHLQ